MPLYEGPDFNVPPQTPLIGQPLAPIAPAETTRTHTFESDLADFQRGADIMLKHAGLLDEAPAGTSFLQNHSRAPLGQLELDTIALSQLGYPIYLVKNTTKRDGSPYPNGYAEYRSIEPAVRQAVPGVQISHTWDVVRRRVNASERNNELLASVRYEEALQVFLDATCDRSTYWGAYEPEYYRTATQPFAAAFRIIEAELPELIKRGYMTSLLHRYSWFSDGYREHFQERANRYDQLLSEGVRPLGYEELLGLSMRHIRFHIKTDPNYPKPPSDQPDDHR